mmetsp:Transcript_107914/g.186091  ORF Transcript_107914/g.186091 Transcript_107914/m.186091 type:complete len:201 (+) Transcript_107914:1085-1687(+)
MVQARSGCSLGTGTFSDLDVLRCKCAIHVPYFFLPLPFPFSLPPLPLEAPAFLRFRSSKGFRPTVLTRGGWTNCLLTTLQFWRISCSITTSTLETQDSDTDRCTKLCTSWIRSSRVCSPMLSQLQMSRRCSWRQKIFRVLMLSSVIRRHPRTARLRRHGVCFRMKLRVVSSSCVQPDKSRCLRFRGARDIPISPARVRDS